MAKKMAVADLRVSAEATDEGIEELAASIKKHGLMRPIVADSTGLVLDGARRLKAVKSLGLKTALVDISDEFNTTMFLVAQNRDGPCHIKPNHHRTYRIYTDTEGQRAARAMMARNQNTANLRNNKPKGTNYTPGGPAREMLQKALGIRAHDLQAGIQLLNISKQPTHPMYEQAVKLVKLMDEGLPGSAAQQRFAAAMRAKAGNSIESNQREVIGNAIINMSAIAATLNRIQLLDPEFTAKELLEWNREFAPIRGALMSLGNRLKAASAERSEENSEQ